MLEWEKKEVISDSVLRFAGFFSSVSPTMTKYLVGSSFLQGKHTQFFVGVRVLLSKENNSIEQMNFSHLERGAWDVQHVLKNQVFQKMFQVRLQTHGWLLKILSQMPRVYVGVCV